LYAEGVVSTGCQGRARRSPVPIIPRPTRPVWGQDLVHIGDLCSPQADGRNVGRNVTHLLLLKIQARHA
jgi:hypothetical protein